MHAATPEKAALEIASSAAEEIGLSPMIKHGAPALFEENTDQGAKSSSIPAVHGPSAPPAAAAPPTADAVQRPSTNPAPGALTVADGSRKQAVSRPATAAAGGGGAHSGHIQPLLFHRLDLVVRPLVGNKCGQPSRPLAVTSLQAACSVGLARGFRLDVAVTFCACILEKW